VGDESQDSSNEKNRENREIMKYTVRLGAQHSNTVALS
jgi:hypothetical protein